MPTIARSIGLRASVSPTGWNSYAGPAFRRPAAARRHRTRRCDGPKVLLLDEVTSALDPELVGEVLTVVSALAETA